jgi:hypothetical protein
MVAFSNISRDIQICLVNVERCASAAEQVIGGMIRVIKISSINESAVLPCRLCRRRFRVGWGRRGDLSDREPRQQKRNHDK